MQSSNGQLDSFQYFKNYICSECIKDMKVTLDQIHPRAFSLSLKGCQFTVYLSFQCQVRSIHLAFTVQYRNNFSEGDK